MIRRVLLTGASGLIGAEVLARLVAAGYDVVPVTRAPADLPAHRRCDLADRSQVDGLMRVAPEAIVHLAGGQRAEPLALYRDNVLTTVHVLEAAAELPAPPYCLTFGSAAEYGGGALLAERADLRPLTEYGRAKAAQTTLARTVAERRGLALTVLRPFNVVSPRLPVATALGNIRAQLLRQSGGRRAVRCGRLDVVRDYVPAAAVAEAVLRLLAAPRPGIFNVCSGTGIALDAIVTAMARRLGAELAIEIDPELAALPAPPAAIGDPAALLQAVGLRIPATADSVAETMLSSS
jgi:nucleoside-diphosphate-sugar epimerase